MTATAVTTGRQQQLATAHNTRTIGPNWGYVRPEKRKVAVPLATESSAKLRCRTGSQKSKSCRQSAFYKALYKLVILSPMLSAGDQGPV
jgi:hypothetical protein